MEALIPLIILVFALSMVSERLANIFKLYIPSFLNALAPGWGNQKVIDDHNAYRFVWANLHLKHEEQELEVIRQRIIMAVSVLCGILIAFFFRKEIVGAVKSVEELGSILSGDNTIKGSLFVVGGFGILFSFGSKFWHDILDLMLYTKNIRRNLQNINPEDFHAAEEIKHYLESSDTTILLEELEKQRSALETQMGTNIRHIAYERIEKGGRLELIAVIYVEERIDRRKEPNYIVVKGNKKKIPVKVVDDLGKIKAQSGPGARLRLKHSNFHGTFGCIVYKNGDDQPYILTCGHNLTQRRIKYQDHQLKAARLVAVDDDGIEYHELNLKAEVDFALLKTSQIGIHSNKFDQFQDYQGIRRLGEEDEINGLSVFFIVERGGRLRKLQGRIKWYSLTESQKIQYDDGTLAFTHLIAVEGSSRYSAPTESGDSGTICFDEHGSAIGMVVGSDNKFTYLQSLYRLSYNYGFDLQRSEDLLS